MEHETIHTLKNQGYHFEHHYGHGYTHLATGFACLMMLAFLVDQVEPFCDVLFQDALEQMGRLKYLRKTMEGMFQQFYIESWEALYVWIAEGYTDSIRMDSS